jgi:hypothetical protein
VALAPNFCINGTMAKDNAMPFARLIKSEACLYNTNSSSVDIFFALK